MKTIGKNLDVRLKQKRLLPWTAEENTWVTEVTFEWIYNWKCNIRFYLNWLQKVRVSFCFYPYVCVSLCSFFLVHFLAILLDFVFVEYMTADNIDSSWKTRNYYNEYNWRIRLFLVDEIYSLISKVLERILIQRSDYKISLKSLAKNRLFIVY